MSRVTCMYVNEIIQSILNLWNVVDKCVRRSRTKYSCTLMSSSLERSIVRERLRRRMPASWSSSTASRRDCSRSWATAALTFQEWPSTRRVCALLNTSWIANTAHFLFTKPSHAVSTHYNTLSGCSIHIGDVTQSLQVPAHPEVTSMQTWTTVRFVRLERIRMKRRSWSASRVLPERAPRTSQRRALTSVFVSENNNNILLRSNCNCKHKKTPSRHVVLFREEILSLPW